MRKNLSWIVLILLLAVPLAIVLDDFARKVIVVPLMYIFWVGNLIFQSIPQSILWVLFLVVAILISLKSFAKSPRPTVMVKDVEKDNPGQVGLWAERFHTKNEWTLSRHIGKLILNVIAISRQQSTNKIREEIESGELETRPEVQTCLELGIKRLPDRSDRSRFGYFFRFRSRRKIALSQKLDPEKVVQFLENQLEVDHDH